MMTFHTRYDLLGERSSTASHWDETENVTIPFDTSYRQLVLGEQSSAHHTDAINPGEEFAYSVNLSLANGTISYPIRDTLWIVVPVSVIYATIFVIGLLGNVITCIVISRNKSMHTATNYYLFSLAISDLLLLLTGVPQDIYRTWYRFPYPFGSGVCKLTSFAAETFANATVLTITAFTVERYVAICKPFLSHTMSKLSRAVRFVLAIWLIALSLAVPQALAMQIDEQFLTCTVRDEQTKHVFFISTVLVFVCPMSVITFLYILIWLQLRRSKVVRCGPPRSSSVRLKHSIFKRASQRTLVTLHYERNDSPELHHYSESALTSSMQQPRPTDALRASPSSSLQYANSCPVTPERKVRRTDGALGHQPHHHPPHHHYRTQSLAQYRTGTTVSVGGSHQQLEQQLSVGSEDGRINYSNRAQYNSTRHVVKMLVAVVIAFFLCWAPFHAQRLMAVYANEHNENAAIRTAFEILTYVSGVLYYISTCINPVLYNIMSHKFREAFKATLSNYFYPRTSQPLSEDLFFRNASWRSNSNNSHSLNTCSSACGCCSTHHLTSDGAGTGCRRCTPLVPIRCVRRPLVVSFRTRRNRTPPAVDRDGSCQPVWKCPTTPTSAEVHRGRMGRPQRNESIRSCGNNEPSRDRMVDDLCFTGQNELLPVAIGERRRGPEVDAPHCGYGQPSGPCQYDLYPQLRCIYPSADGDLSPTATREHLSPPVGKCQKVGGAGP